MGFFDRVTVVKPDSVAVTTFNSTQIQWFCFPQPLKEVVQSRLVIVCGQQIFDLRMHASLALASCVPPVSSIPVSRRSFRTLNFTMADVSCLAVVMCMSDFSSEQDVSFLLRRETACTRINWFVTVL